MKKKLIAIGSAMILLAGCANNLVWTHPTKTYNDFNQDKIECEYEATKYGYIPNMFGVSPIAAGIESGIRQAQIFNKCMELKGYRLQKKEQ